jgi:hypothetical protein
MMRSAPSPVGKMAGNDLTTRLLRLELPAGLRDSSVLTQTVDECRSGI